MNKILFQLSAKNYGPLFEPIWLSILTILNLVNFLNKDAFFYALRAASLDNRSIHKISHTVKITNFSNHKRTIKGP